MSTEPPRGTTPSPYQFFMLGLCVYALLALAAQTLVPLSPETVAILDYADVGVCALFLLDFLRNLATAESRWRYFVTWGWLDLISSIPAIDVFRWGRAARIFRILRVLRGVRAIRILGSFAAERRVESTVWATLFVAIMLIIFGSIGVLHLEARDGGNLSDPSDALWWAFVTITTVGYGDFFPLSGAGRILAGVLMVAGIGVFAAFTALVASSFIDAGKDDQDRELALLRMQVAELKEMIAHTVETKERKDGTDSEGDAVEAEVRDLGLTVFVDATPSEQVGKDSQERLCVVGVSCEQPQGVPGLRQYKDCGSSERPEIAASISDAIVDGSLCVWATGVVAPMDRVEALGHEALEGIEGGRWQGETFKVPGASIRRNTVVALSWYTGALAVVSAAGASWAKRYGLRKVSVLIDRLPGDTARGIKILRRTATAGPIRESWEAVRPLLEADGFDDILVDTLEEFEVDGRSHKGKDHPHAILADWLSHSLHARENSAELLDNGTGRSESYRSAIASPWKKLEELGRAKSGESLGL